MTSLAQRSTVRTLAEGLRPHYREDIDSLRAIAVIAVIINHLERALLPGGYLGVDVFFVISGYVITASVENARGKSLQHFLLSFYARRVKRLVPALLLCVLVTSVFECLFDVSRFVSLKTGLVSLFGAANLYLFRNGVDYFGSSVEFNAFTHMWSLGVEEQYYLLFPALFWWARCAKYKAENDQFIGHVLIGLTVLSLGLNIVAEETTRYFLMPFRVWELTAGAACVYVFRRNPSYNGTKLPGIVQLAPLAILFVVFLAPSLERLAASGIAVGATIMLIGPGKDSPAIQRFLRNRSLLFVGLISYSLYLWHWPLVTLFRKTIGVNGWSAPIFLLLVVTISVLSYRFIEAPCRVRVWSDSSARVLLYGFGSSVVVAGVIGLLMTPVGGKFYLGKEIKFPGTGIETLLQSQSLRGPTVWTAEDCVLSQNTHVGKRIRAENCSFEPAGSTTRRLLVVGNSFSVAEIEMYKPLAEDRLASITITSSWGATPVPEIENKTPWRLANNDYWQRVVPSLISDLKRGDFLLMVNDIADLSPEVENEESRRRLELLESGLLRISRSLDRQGVTVIFQHSLPFISDSNCTPEMAVPQWFNSRHYTPCRVYPRGETIARRSSLDRHLRSAERQVTNLKVLDLIDIFCPETFCTFFGERGMLLYRDRTHPTASASRSAHSLLRTTMGI